MKAVAVYPGKPHSVHMAELPMPRIDEVPGGRGVLVKLLRVGVDATDREIVEAKYGAAPPGYDFLVIGHESFGVVEEVGANVTELRPGDYVTATVRRPGSSIYDLIGTCDMTSEEVYYERGINLLHGFLTERYVDSADYIVKMPAALKHFHVLIEPLSCAEKAVCQAYEAQRRLRVWRPRRAFVMGSGQIGLLATLVLRLRGLEVYTLARSRPPTVSSGIVEALGARYVSTRETSLVDLAGRVGKADLIVEATGSSEVAFRAMEVVGHNGVLVWTSITGGREQRQVPADQINLDWVLGNKLLLGCVNANREHFEMGVKDLAAAELAYPGVIQRILTHPVRGLENYAEAIRLLSQEKPPLKVFVEVAEG